MQSTPHNHRPHPLPSPFVASSLRRFVALLLLFPSLSRAATFIESPLTTLPERVLPEQVILSPDARHYAYVTRRGAQLAVVRDGVEGKPYDWIIGHHIAFTPDGQHILYQVRNRNGLMTVFDDQPSSSYTALDTFILSPTGSRFAYAAQRNGQIHPVIDGKELPPRDHLRMGALAPNRTAYIVSTPAGESVQDNTTPGPTYDQVADLRLSPDGQHLAYRARRDKQWFLVLDGVESPAYPSLGPPTFSPTGSRLAHTAARDAQPLLLIHTLPREGEAPAEPKSTEISLPYPLIDQPLFSPNGQRLIYILQKGSSQVLVENGKESPPYDRITALTFSPDSRRLTFLAYRGDQTFVVLDNREHPVTSPNPRTLTFSPDSQHIAWIARQSNQDTLFLDTHPHRTYDRILPTLAWDSPTTLRCVAVREQYTEVIRNEKPTRLRECTLIQIQAKISPPDPK